MLSRPYFVGCGETNDLGENFRERGNDPTKGLVSVNPSNIRWIREWHTKTISNNCGGRTASGAINQSIQGGQTLEEETMFSITGRLWELVREKVSDEHCRGWEGERQWKNQMMRMMERRQNWMMPRC